MPTTCECGMTVEQPSRWIGCRECGAVRCRSCAIEVDGHTYCRWCAASAAASAA